MKIAFFLSGSEYGGGLSQFNGFLDAVKSLNLDNHEIIYITDKISYQESLKKKKIECLLFKKNFFTKILFFFYGIKNISKFYIFNSPNPFEKFINKNKIDLLVFSDPSFYSIYCENVKFVINIWNTELKSLKIFNELSGKNFIYQDRIISSAVLNAYKIIVFTKKNKEDLIKFYNCSSDKIITQNLMPNLPNSYNQLQDKINFTEIFKELNLDKDIKWFFYPAQFWSHKNHVYLIDALRLVKDKNINNIGFLFSGKDNGNLEYIKKLINSNDLNKNVKILGFLSEPQIISIYKFCYGVVIPTYVGRSSLPLLESIFFNKKIIYGKDILDDELKEYVEEVDLNNANDLSLKLTSYDFKNVGYNSDSYNKICSKKKFLNTYINIINEFNFIRKKWE
jgi:hypothetical protein